MEGFRIKFKENQLLSDKIYRWIRSTYSHIDLKSFLLASKYSKYSNYKISVDLLTKRSNYLLLLDSYQLLLMISIGN